MKITPDTLSKLTKKLALENRKLKKESNEEETPSTLDALQELSDLALDDDDILDDEGEEGGDEGDVETDDGQEEPNPATDDEDDGEEDGEEDAEPTEIEDEPEAEDDGVEVSDDLDDDELEDDGEIEDDLGDEDDDDEEVDLDDGDTGDDFGDEEDPEGLEDDLEDGEDSLEGLDDDDTIELPVDDEVEVSIAGDEGEDEENEDDVEEAADRNRAWRRGNKARDKAKKAHRDSKKYECDQVNADAVITEEDDDAFANGPAEALKQMGIDDPSKASPEDLAAAKALLDGKENANESVNVTFPAQICRFLRESATIKKDPELRHAYFKYARLVKEHSMEARKIAKFLNKHFGNKMITESRFCKVFKKVL